MIGNFAVASSGDGISLIRQILIIWILTCSYQSPVIIITVFWDVLSIKYFLWNIYNDIGGSNVV